MGDPDANGASPISVYFPLDEPLKTLLLSLARSSTPSHREGHNFTGIDQGATYHREVLENTEKIVKILYSSSKKIIDVVCKELGTLRGPIWKLQSP